MDLNAYLRVIRRRWLLILGAAVAALLVVALTLPSTVGDRAPDTPSSYTATATLVNDPMSALSLDLNAAALYTTIGEVPERVAARLDFDDEPQLLASMVTATVSAETGTLAITSTDSDAAVVKDRVNAFAAELIAFFDESARAAARADVVSLSQMITESSARLAELDRRLTRRPGDTALAAEREGLRVHHQGLVAQFADVQSAPTPEAALTVLQEAVALPQATVTFAPPASAAERLLIGGALGLALGLALALVIERLDSRILSREQAEDAYGVPVLAEIPSRSWLRGRRARTVGADPGGMTAEAYRGLRSSILLLHRPRDDERARTSPGNPTVILVTSARRAEGKSTTVANLAVVLAESGRRVLVLSLDLRSPTVEQDLGCASRRGISDLLSAGRPEDLESVVHDTPHAGVRLAASGHKLTQPGALLADVGPLIRAAREQADVVLIDSAPLLSVSDALDISPYVDSVLVVCRANRTTTAQAAGTKRLLTRADAPTIGVALVTRPHPTVEGYPREQSHRLRARPTVWRRDLAHALSERPTALEAPRGRNVGTKGVPNHD